MEKIRIGTVALAIFIALVGVIGTAEAGSYNGNSAAVYAITYAINPNPAYRDFTNDGGDCANFVSQSLLAGGWEEIGKYSYTSDDAWYYDGSYTPLYSYTWTSATHLYNFMMRHSNRATYRSLSNTLWPNYFQRGDIIQIDYQKDGIIDHSMIVTGTNGNDLVMAYHTPNSKDKSLQEIVNANPNARFIGWHINANY